VSQIRAAPDADRRRVGSLGVRELVKVVAIDRQLSAAPLLPCQDAELVPDPETASDEQVEVERVNVARAYVDCRQRHADLVTFVKRGYLKETRLW